MNTFNYGVDVGNHDTKTAHTSLISGYNAYTSKPEMCQEYLKLNDIYYVPTSKRFAYKMDKTEDEQALVLTLLGIAKESIFRINRNKVLTRNEQQSVINKITDINLGTGVPPMHCNMLSKKTREYYEEYLKDTVSFEYNGFDFNLKAKNIFVFPQAYAAINNNKKCTFVTKYPKVYVVDIGGFTVDVLTIINGQPDLSIVASKQLGVLKLYQQIQNEVLRLKGYELDDFMIESVLLNKPHSLQPDVVELIQKHAAKWSDNIISTLREMGIEFQAYPSVFLGGGSLLFKKTINKNSIVGLHEFINDVNANARGYERMLQQILYNSERK